MTIKLIVTDFDGVLADLKLVHFVSLNKAIEKIAGDYSISYKEHVGVYDGLSTIQKLNLLVDKKNFPKEKIKEVFDLKQKLTTESMNEVLVFDKNLYDTFLKLKNENYILYVASNAIKETIENGLKLLGIYDLFDKIYSNQDVNKPKPHPEIYLRCMVDAGVGPKETLIIEDSKNGRESAYKSGAYVCTVADQTETTYDYIKRTMNKYNDEKINKKWIDNKLNVVIPMAGEGSRFKIAGYTFPKPLIDIKGKPMIQVVVENLNIDANYIYIVRKEHYEKYNLKYLLNMITPNCNIVQVDQLTEGAACTVLLAKEYINNDNNMLIANSDQFVEWDSCDFLYKMISHKNVDGGILTFKSTHPKWSYINVDEEDNVIDVQEKKVISDIATVGIYYYAKGSDFVKYAEKMISDNVRVNNEFYVAPIYNEYIKDNKIIKHYDVDKLWGLGVPEDLQYFLGNYNGKI